MNKLGINQKYAYDYILMHINTHIILSKPSLYQQGYDFFK